MFTGSLLARVPLVAAVESQTPDRFEPLTINRRRIDWRKKKTTRFWKARETLGSLVTSAPPVPTLKTDSLTGIRAERVSKGFNEVAASHTFVPGKCVQLSKPWQHQMSHIYCEGGDLNWFLSHRALKSPGALLQLQKWSRRCSFGLPVRKESAELLDRPALVQSANTFTAVFAPFKAWSGLKQQGGRGRRVMRGKGWRVGEGWGFLHSKILQNMFETRK